MSVRKRKKNIVWLKRLTIIHSLVFLFGLTVYVELVFLLGPRFLVSDAQEKFRFLAGAVTFSLRIYGPPAEPVVTATPVCSAGVSRIALDWPDDPDTSTWDIERDGNTLVTGLATSSYDDGTVVEGDAYSYVVTANSPMGFASVSSQAVSATALECVVLPTPFVILTGFHTTDLLSDPGELSTSNRRPRFSGVTNISQAVVTLTVSGGQTVNATTTANGNGYWEWTPPVNLTRDEHTISIIVADPGDPLRTASLVVAFTIEEEDEEKEQDSDRGTSSAAPPSASAGAADQGLAPSAPVLPPAGPSIAPEHRTAPVSFRLSLPNGATAVQGERIDVELTLEEVEEGSADTTATYHMELQGEDGSVLDRKEGRVRLRSGERIREEFPISLSFVPGERYRVVAYLEMGGDVVSREVFFRVVPLPVFSLGSREFTVNDFGRLFGWVVAVSLLLLLLWLLLLYREYRLYLHATRLVAERELARLGLLGRRREVSV